MAIQILPRERGLVEGFGEGLSSGLQALANLKLNEYAQRQQRARTARGLQAFGLSPALADLDPSILREIIKQKFLAPQQQEFGSILGQIAGGAPQQEQPAFMQQLQQLQQEAPQEAAQQSLGFPQQKIPMNVEERLLAGLQQQLPQQAPEQQIAQQPLAPQVAEQAVPTPKARTTNEDRLEQLAASKQRVAQSLAQGKLRPADADRLLKSINDEEKSIYNRQKIEQKSHDTRLAQIEKVNAPYIQGLDKSYGVESKINSIAKEMLELWKTGKVATSWQGKLTPYEQLNAESKQFQKLSDALAPYIAAGTGIASVLKIKLAQTSKPALNDDAETQKAGIDGLLKRTKKILDRYKIKNSIIEKNNGEQPANISTLVENKYKKQRHSEKKLSKEIQAKNTFQGKKLGESFDELPPASQYTGKKIVSPEGKVLMSDGNEWKEE